MTERSIERAFATYRMDNARLKLWAVIDWWAYETKNAKASRMYADGAERRDKGYYDLRELRGGNGK